MLPVCRMRWSVGRPGVMRVMTAGRCGPSHLGNTRPQLQTLQWRQWILFGEPVRGFCSHLPRSSCPPSTLMFQIDPPPLFRLNCFISCRTNPECSDTLFVGMTIDWRRCVTVFVWFQHSVYFCFAQSVTSSEGVKSQDLWGSLSADTNIGLHSASGQQCCAVVLNNK